MERETGGRILQAVCSPVRNPLPRLLRWFAVVMSYGVATPIGAGSSPLGEGTDPPFRWRTVKGPWFDNNLALLRDGPDALTITWHTGVVVDGDQDHPRLEDVASVTVPTRREAALVSQHRSSTRASRQVRVAGVP